MTKNKLKFYLDFTPLVIMIVYATILLWTVFANDTGFLWQHIVGLIVLPINIGLFLWRHKTAVLALGLTLILGLVGLLSFNHSVAITTTTIGKNSDFQIPIFYGQTTFLLWLLIHFIVSGRYYVGIVTKKFWQDFLNNSGTQTNS